MYADLERPSNIVLKSLIIIYIADTLNGSAAAYIPGMYGTCVLTCINHIIIIKTPKLHTYMNFVFINFNKC